MITEFREKGAPTKWTFTAARLEQNLRRRLERKRPRDPLPIILPQLLRRFILLNPEPPGLSAVEV